MLPNTNVVETGVEEILEVEEVSEEIKPTEEVKTTEVKIAKVIKEDIVLSQSVLVTLYSKEEEFSNNPSKIRVRIIDPEEFDLIGDKVNRRRFIIFAHAKWATGTFSRSGKTFVKAQSGDSWLVDIIKHKHSIYAVPVELADKSIKK